MEVPTPGDILDARTTEDGEVKYTQSEVAERAGVSQPLIARIEGGDVDPRMSTLRDIVQALDELEREQTISAKNIMNKKVASVAPRESVVKARDKMVNQDYSQLPVLDGNVSRGSISFADVIQSNMAQDDLSDNKVGSIMAPPFPAVDKSDNLNRITGYLQHSKAVIVVEAERTVGIITEADVAAAIS